MKTDDKEIRINARKLSSPGPRLMAENALADTTPAVVRVIVSNDEAAHDVTRYLQDRGATVRTDILGDDIHVIASFAATEQA